MRVERHDDPQGLTLHVEDRQAARSLLEPAVEQGALLVSLAEAPPLLEPIRLRVTVRDAGPLDLEVRAVQVFPSPAGQQVAFEVSPEAGAEVRRWLRGPVGGAADESESRGVSPMLRIQEMNPAERARLALKGGRTERHILRRDRSPLVLQNLLANPRADAEDVLAVVKSTHVNAGILERIASDRRWMGNPEIRSQVVRNPKTPPPTAIRLLDTLRTEDLRQLSKMGAHRENVRRAALRIYLKRQSK